MKEKISKNSIIIPEEILKKWQNTVDIMAKLIQVPAALIMKAGPEYLEVFRSSRSKGNPYHTGEKTPRDGLYCETVISKKEKLLVPNALKSKKWKENPDIELGMVSYLGFPILWPDQEPFGTICVLDTAENAFGQETERLMQQFRDILEAHLGLLYTSEQLKKEVKKRKETETNLQESKDKFKSITEYAKDGILMVDADYRLTYVNRKVCEILEYGELELIGQDFRNFLDKESKIVVTDRYERRQKGEEVPASYEFNVITKNGSKRFMEVSSTIIKDKQQKVRTIAHVRDITERKKTEEALLRERNQLEGLHKAFEKIQRCQTESELFIKAIGVADKILHFDLCTLYIVDGNHLIPKAFSREALPEGMKSHRLNEGIAGLTLRKGESIQGEDLKKWKEAKPSRDDIKSFMSVPIGKIGVLQTFSKQKNTFSRRDLNLAEIFAGHLREEIARLRLEKKLREQAIQDSLTGLFNRRYLRQSIKNDLARCKRYNTQLSFMMIDINRFKEINDRYSHQTGDKLLQEVAGLLKKTVRNSDTVVRYGGDEFLIVLLETGGNTDQVKKRIRKNVQKWNKKQNLFDFPLTLAVGSSHWDPQSGKDLEDMLKEADLNMYRNKKKFRKKSARKRGF